MQHFRSGWIFLTTVALIFLTLSVSMSAETEKASKDQVASVNGKAISRQDFDREMKMFEDRMKRSGKEYSEVQLSSIRLNVLESLIDQEVLIQESLKQGIAVNSKEIDEHFSAVRKRYPTQAEFEEALGRIDLTEKDLKNKIEGVIAVNQLVQSTVVEKVTVSEAESKTYYEANSSMFKESGRVKASHILIMLDPSADQATRDEAEKKIEAVQKKLAAGEDFAELAKKHSEGPSNVKGGDLGYFGRGQMVKPFEDTAFSLNAGDVSGVVETQFGLHLIKVLDKTPERAKAYDEIKEQLTAQMKNEKAKSEVRKYVESLRGAAEIERSL